MSVKTRHPASIAREAETQARCDAMEKQATLPPTACVRFVRHEEQSSLYRHAFDQVCNPDDWKAEVACWVPWSMANLYMQAIEFMTGVLPSCGGRVVLTTGEEVTFLSCVGYRRGPCGG